MTNDEVLMLWVYAHEKWSNFEIPDDSRVRNVKMQAWLDELGDLAPGPVRAAMVALGASQFIPALGLLREEALDLARLEQGIPRCPELDQAWAEVTAAINAGGSRTSPSWSHPAVAETVRSIGWTNLCASTNQDVIRGQFARMYETARRRVMKTINPPAPALASYQPPVALTSGSDHE